MNPIKYLFEKPILTRKVTRWQVLLSEYVIIYITQKEIKGRAFTNYLTHGLTNEYHSLQDKFLDEEVLALVNENDGQADGATWTMFFDNASNLMGHGIDAILMSSRGKHILVTTRLDFDCTNNMTECEAFILGLQVTLDNVITKLEVYDDSTLVLY
ncbi:uncharacterized protein LOC109794336 [Cajanus cajan]|uniref:uncharacterized protein LOC109794336 n=1 Tax=Cajanus cajan TaxID=3821 RepID=UPI00098D7E8D|nr:uncharacterized protein LOC109794336 [Cajanus cajan]